MNLMNRVFNKKIQFNITIFQYTSTLTILIIINTKDKSIKITTLIDYKAEKIFIYKDLIK